MQKLTGKEIREGFGQTEGTVLLANFPWITPKPGSTGKPSPLYNITCCGTTAHRLRTASTVRW